MKQKILFLFLSCVWISVYSQDYNRTIGEGDYLDVVITTSHSVENHSGVSTLNGLGLMPNLAATSRFLAQSTLGVDFATIELTAEKGYSAWLEEQLNMPVNFSLLSYCDNIIDRYKARLTEAGKDTSLADGDGSYWVENYFLFSWWKYVMDSDDLLRARVALAMSEILVVSATPDLMYQPLGLASYYDILIRNAFGNYRDILEEITYHPIMARYLTYLNNRKTKISSNRYPDENYAREIMQLFTIGLFELNLDGTQKIDVSGNPIPTYDIDDIREFAKIFTGLSWGDRTTFGESGSKVKYWSCKIPLQMFNSEHEPGEKKLLNNLVVPNRNPVDGNADINDALDNLFNHQNVGPFISRRLIQRLVTSNPSPEYIARVATVFNNNGQGERGDLKSVVKALLIDPEARSCASGIYSGKLKEPIHRQLQLLKGYNARSVSGEYRYSTSESYLDATGQRVLYSPSVFNFFQPDYKPVGEIADAGLYAPEFQIVHSVTIIGYMNAIHKWIFEDNLAGNTELFPGENSPANDVKLKLKLDEELALLSQGKIEELVERLNLVLMQGQMSEETRDIIINSLQDIQTEGNAFQLDMALYLTMISPEFLILK